MQALLQPAINKAVHSATSLLTSSECPCRAPWAERTLSSSGRCSNPRIVDSERQSASDPVGGCITLHYSDGGVAEVLPPMNGIDGNLSILYG